jgi:hypothetical protein
MWKHIALSGILVLKGWAYGQQPGPGYGKPAPQMTAVNDALSPDTPRRHSIQLVYDDATLSDSARAKLISILAHQPPGDLKTVTVTRADQGITKLVQNNFNLSGITDRLSVREMAASIMAMNHLTSGYLVVGQTLAAPGLPSRVYRTDDLAKPSFRVAAAGSTQIVVAKTPNDLRQSDQLPVAADPRNGNLTAKGLADPEYLADLAWKSGSTPVLPIGVMPLEDGGNIQIHLADASQCTSQEWLPSSPFYTQLQASMTAFLAQTGKHDLLLSGAAALPLIVIDWNDDDKKHGQKVTSVIKYVLAQLGVGDLPFHEVDLNPANNAVELKGIFTDYLNNYYCTLQGINCKLSGQKGLIDDVSKWLNSKPKSVNGIASVKQLLLEAVLWKYFDSSRAVVNMSFSVDSLALEILQAQFLAASHSVGIVAASDDSEAEGTAGIPQRAASIYPNFLNVTYGNTDGTILGGFSNSTFNVIVTTVAQGCGFSYGDIVASDAGTSFAAPYVSAGIWLNALMHGGDTSTVRRDLVEASDVSRAAQSPRVESSGTFNLPTFFLPGTYYVIDGQGAATVISSGKLEVVSSDDSGGMIDQTFVSGSQVTIAFINDGAIVRARIRTLRKGADSPLPVAEVSERVVTNATLDAVVAGNGSAAHYDLARIKSSVVEVKF